MPDCTLSTLVAASKCYDCFSELQKKAAEVYFLAQALKAGGGTDYTNTNTLRSAAVCFNCEEEDSRMQSFEVVVAQRKAVAAGFAGSVAPSDVAAATKLLSTLSLQELNSFEALLRCNLA